jgi:superfamily II DNA or RNA helicase
MVELLEMGATIKRNKDEKSIEDQELESLTFARADILKKAEFKVTALEAVLGRLGAVRNCLIYCTDREQMIEAMHVLNARGLIYKVFTGEEGTLPQNKFGGISEREWILKDFQDGHTQVLVAMKCLDEGVDIPSAEIGVIMASTTNPREFIQRRGRLLRRSPGKSRARIFDLVVAPSAPEDADTPEGRAVRSIFYRELRRVEEFARDAIDSTRANATVVGQILKMGVGQ